MCPPPVTGSSATMRRGVSSSGASKIAIPVLTWPRQPRDFDHPAGWFGGPEFPAAAASGPSRPMVAHPGQMPVLSGFACGFATFDHRFCEVPSQTFTDRSFFPCRRHRAMSSASPRPAPFQPSCHGGLSPGASGTPAAIPSPLTVRFAAHWACLPARVMDVHRRQVLHLLLGDAEPDTVIDPGHYADGDSHFLAAPQGPSWRSTWVTWWLSGSMTSPWTFPMRPSVAWTCSPRRTSTSSSGTAS